MSTCNWIEDDEELRLTDANNKNEVPINCLSFYTLFFFLFVLLFLLITVHLHLSYFLMW
ncbi:unnamed protein product [Brugia timori]|uniref:Uncharacterized protein n=1 Tax=Brugia timori TaxID=42155 RepID=A0A0R3QH13_9BILA|nr:unnamed protein product [Brugia timori]